MNPRRPTKRNQAEGAVVSGADGHSPIGVDDNEEVRQRSASALKSLVLPLAKGACAAQTSHKSSTHMHFPRRPYPSPIRSHITSISKQWTLTDPLLQLSENQDYCSSCGGSGYLLCCDGCDRSFHFNCLDPPLNANASELNEPWFCYICVSQRPMSAAQPQKASRGLFAGLLNNLNKQNPKNFSLPQEIREYYDGVGTGKNGEFQEVTAGPKSR